MMQELYESSTKIVIRWLEDFQRILMENGNAYRPGDGGTIDQVYKTINAIHHAEKIPPSKNIPSSSHCQVDAQWMELMYDELFQFNARGHEYICSTTEALIKCNGLKRKLDSFNVPVYFRGEHYFGWELISRLGRKIKIDWDENDPNIVTEKEIELVTNFQTKVKNNDNLRVKIFGDSKMFSSDDPGWWSIMQHYDDQYGTRMIDVTSSLFCALYFACVDWDGTVDTNSDGKLYLFPYQPGRGTSLKPDMWKGQIIGPEDRVYTTLTDYYSVDSSVDYPRFRRSPVRNDRALSQDGLFVWQPKFTLPLKTFQLFQFRIHREYKKNILKELSSMGYTQERILSHERYGH